MTLMRTLVVALACPLWASGAFAQGKWTKLAVFPEPAEELLGASAGGRMYVFCGLAPGWKPIGMVYEYDPATDKRTKRKPIPAAPPPPGARAGRFRRRAIPPRAASWAEKST